MNVLFAIASIEVGGAERIFCQAAAAVRAAGGRAGLMVPAENRGRTVEYPTDCFDDVVSLPLADWRADSPAMADFVRRFDLVNLALLGPRLRWPFLFLGRPVIHSVFSILGWCLWYPTGFLGGERKDALATDNAPTAAYVQDQCPALRVRCIPNGVDLELYKPRSFLEEGAARQVPVVGSLGRISPWAKHPRMFARVAALVQARAREAGRPEPIFRWLGGSRPEERPLEDALHKLAADGGGRIEISGYLPDERLRDELAALDCFLLTSASEGCPIALLEAMASGVPCVATAVGGVPEVLLEAPGERPFARLVAVDDDAAAAEWIWQYLDSAWLRREHGQFVRARAEERYSLARMQAAYLDLYAEVLGRRNG
jgi:glycosyltransferase involved in cell wall biosynthesis